MRAAFSGLTFGAMVMKGSICSISKNSAGAFLQNRRSEGTKRLAVLHAGIDAILHCCVAGIGEDGAIAERPRTKLGPALKPADDLAGGDIAGDRRSVSSSSLMRR